MGISNETKDLIRDQIEKCKTQKAGIEAEMQTLKSRRDDLSTQRDVINGKLQKFQTDLGA
jgi:FtsZ-binding cell division protein ZapB